MAVVPVLPRLPSQHSRWRRPRSDIGVDFRSVVDCVGHSPHDRPRSENQPQKRSVHGYGSGYRGWRKLRDSRDEPAGVLSSLPLWTAG